MRHLFVAGVLACACASVTAWPTLDLSFTQPAGTASSSESIPVWVTLSVGASGPALRYAPSASSPFGLSPGDLPAFGDDGMGHVYAFTQYSSAVLGNWYGCSGSFTQGCATGAYRFDFNADLWAGLADADGSLSLAPGQSVDLLWGSFVPQGSGAPAGDYVFYRAVLGLSVSGEGVDGQGHAVTLSATAFPFQTCSDGKASCAFTRTVAAVPEATSLQLFGLGLLTLSLGARRRPPQTTTGSGSSRMPKRP